MNDDLPNSDVADQLHDDLLVNRLTDTDNTGFSNDLKKGASVDEVPKTPSGVVFLQPRLEYGETVEQCAMREVEEETGLDIHSTIPGPYTGDLFASERKHYVTLFVLAHSTTGEPEVREPESG